MAEPRDIALRIRLVGGHEHMLTLREDAPELRALFTALAAPDAGDGFVQLPLDGGQAACSFRTSQLVSIISRPPVVVDAPEMPVDAAPAPPSASRVSLRRPRHVVIDDFLGLDEHREMLALVTASEEHFAPGTVTTDDPEHRQNLVIMGFGESAHAKLIQNRLLIWFPLLMKSLGGPVFPLAAVESQLTAAGGGQYFKAHADQGPDMARALSCIYYLHREPRGFAGGELRLYDCLEESGGRRPAETYAVVEPVSNRMVVFPSEEFHEARPVRCPSGEFADNRFAITTWFHRSKEPLPGARFGWGHFRCGVVAPQFASSGLPGSHGG